MAQGWKEFETTVAATVATTITVLDVIEALPILKRTRPWGPHPRKTLSASNEAFPRAGIRDDRRYPENLAEQSYNSLLLFFFGSRLSGQRLLCGSLQCIPNAKSDAVETQK